MIRNRCGLLSIATIGMFFCCVLLITAATVNAESVDQAATGVITVQSPGSIKIMVENGTEERFLTGRKTVFVPDDYRSQEGDTVKVLFYEKAMRGVMEKAVSRLELVSLDPTRIDLKNEVTGEIREVGRRWVRIFVPQSDNIFLFEKARGMRVEPSDWEPAQNDQVKVSFDRIPSKFGNKYAYYIRHLSLNAAN